jgi:7,8-dihydro-6-hydroxymethylpterin dimethyltransferase
MHRNSKTLSLRTAETAVCALSDFVWHLTRVGSAFFPKRERSARWAPGWLSRRPDRSVIPLGIPRTIQSVCPNCVTEGRNALLRGTANIDGLKCDPGIIRAEIVEEAGRVLIRKICPIHGPFEDLLAANAAFFRRMERLYPGPDFACSEDELVHDHGVSSIRWGRGAFLVFDLTNRCNMKCWPCFMDANAASYVHELDLEDIEAILQRARSFKPRRELNILFSGGEPTISPFFLQAVRCAREAGFRRLHVATNGIRFAQEPGFAEQARQAGLHGVFLQFDAVSEERNGHRGIGNLFEAKLKAIENLARAGLRVTLQSTVVNRYNEDQVGPIVEFAIQNIDKVFSVVFQPIMFAGRDRDVDDERRYRQRYTLSQLAADLSSQVQTDWQPLRDWFPTAIMSRFGNVLDLLHSANAEEGSVMPNEHPDWAVMSPLLANRRTRRWVPLTQFFDLERFATDLEEIAGASRGSTMTYLQLVPAVLRNYKPERAPTGFSITDLVDLFRQCAARARVSGPDWEIAERGTGDWTLLIVYGQVFQDTGVYDLSAIETSMTPVATQEGEVAFSAYNTIGWRDLVEQRHQTAKLSQWHRQHGRHEIYAHGRLVQVSNVQTIAESDKAARKVRQ